MDRGRESWNRQCNGGSRDESTGEDTETDVDGSVVSSSRVFSNSLMVPRGPSCDWTFHHLPQLPLEEMSQRLFNVIQLPLLPAASLFSHNYLLQNTPSPQIGLSQAPPVSLTDALFHDRADFIRQPFMWSALFTRRADGTVFGGSLSLRMLPNGNGAQTELVFEDILVFSQPSVHNTADSRDQHEDMRLDVDNMSYEELLALEERIGNVSTGLAEDMLVDCLKHSKYVLPAGKGFTEEYCSICQEEYVEEDEMGTLDCGHAFHTPCIRQWLTCKNLCPVCKSTGIIITSDVSRSGESLLQ